MFYTYYDCMLYNIFDDLNNFQTLNYDIWFCLQVDDEYSHIEVPINKTPVPSTPNHLY